MDRLKNISLRLVEESDAAFIVESRNDPLRAKYLKPVSDLSAQQQWIRDYKKREATGAEYYLIAESRATGERLGAARLQDIKDGAVTWGSWFTRPGAPHWAGLESALAILDYAFTNLKAKMTRFEVMEGNRSIEWHDTYARRTGVRPGFVDFEVTAEAFAALKQRYRGRFVRDETASSD